MRIGTTISRGTASVSLLGGVIIGGLGTHPAFADTVFTDGTFNLSQYTVTPFQPFSGDVVTVTQASNGNPGTAAQATIQLPAQTTSAVAGAYLLNNGFVYNPASSGPLASLDFSGDRLTSVTGAAVIGSGNVTSLIGQNGKIYEASFPLGSNQQNVWLSVQQTGVIASQYILISDTTMGTLDTTSHPDFAGAAMTFGFRMQFDSSASAIVATLETDNITYDLHAAVPTTVTWINWNQSSFSGASMTGVAGASATGSLGGVIGVTYSGDLAMSTFVPSWSWTPVSSFSGGTVANNPPTANGEITETGGSQTEALTFSQSIHNPVLAVASLGRVGLTASLVFPASEPFTIQAGGTQSNLGGSAITLCPGSTTSICGAEASGVLQFFGDYSQLTWSNPTQEYYDVITAGYDAPAPSASVDAPIPAWALPLLGVALIAAAPRRRHDLRVG